MLKMSHRYGQKMNQYVAIPACVLETGNTPNLTLIVDNTGHANRQ